jgi:hypothetical protein
MRPMRWPDDVVERGQDEGTGSPTLSPPRVRGLFGLSSAIFNYVMREIKRVAQVLTRTNDVRDYYLIGKPAELS